MNSLLTIRWEVCKIQPTTEGFEVLKQNNGHNEVTSVLLSTEITTLESPLYRTKEAVYSLSPREMLKENKSFIMIDSSVY